MSKIILDFLDHHLEQANTPDKVVELAGPVGFSRFTAYATPLVEEAELSDLQRKYKSHFRGTLAQFGVASPTSLDQKGRFTFFSAIKNGWVKGVGPKNMQERAAFNADPIPVEEIAGIEATPLARKIREFIILAPGKTVTDIAEAVDAPLSDVVLILKRLDGLDYITMVPTQPGGSEPSYISNRASMGYPGQVLASVENAEEVAASTTPFESTATPSDEALSIELSGIEDFKAGVKVKALWQGDYYDGTVVAVKGNSVEVKWAEAGWPNNKVSVKNVKLKTTRKPKAAKAPEDMTDDELLKELKAPVKRTKQPALVPGVDFSTDMGRSDPWLTIYRNFDKTSKKGGPLHVSVFGPGKKNLLLGFTYINEHHGKEGHPDGKLSPAPWQAALVLKLTSKGWEIRDSGNSRENPLGVRDPNPELVKSFPYPETKFFGDKEADAIAKWYVENSLKHGATVAQERKAYDSSPDETWRMQVTGD